MAKKKKHPKDKMKVQKKGKQWFIVNVPKGWYVEGYGPEFGPYDDRAEALDDLEGLHRLALDMPELID